MTITETGKSILLNHDSVRYYDISATCSEADPF